MRLAGQQPFHLAAIGEHGKFSFSVTAPPKAATAQITARAAIGGATYDNQHIEISYLHIPSSCFSRSARIKAVSLDLTVRVGYIAGAGDTVADAITQMGCEDDAQRG